jgi:hypothetical protein
MKTPFVLLMGLVFALSSSCREKPSPQPEKLSPLYVELLLLNEEYKLPLSNLTPEQYSARVKEILEKYGTTKEEFIRHIQNLSNEPETLKGFYENVSRMLLESKNKR